MARAKKDSTEDTSTDETTTQNAADVAPGESLPPSEQKVGENPNTSEYPTEDEQADAEVKDERNQAKIDADETDGKPFTAGGPDRTDTTEPEVDTTPEPTAPIFNPLVSSVVGPQQIFDGEMKKLAEKRKGSEPEGRILGPEDPITFSADEDESGQVIVSEDVYRRILPPNSDRYTYKLVLSKGAALPPSVAKQS